MLTKKQQKIIIDEFKAFDHIKSGVSSSYVLGEHTEKSNIDILYSFNKSPTFSHLGNHKKD